MPPESLFTSIRDPLCSKCAMSGSSEKSTCIMPEAGSDDVGAVLVVTKYPLWDKARSELNGYLDDAGVPERRVFTAAVKCRSDNEPTKKDIRTCGEYLRAQIEAMKPAGILAIGNEPLLALTGRVGIMKYRAKVFEVGGAEVFPTISPAMVKRNPGQRVGFMADLEYFARRLKGQDAPTGPPSRMRVVTSVEGYEALRDALRASEGVSYDIETNMFDEFTPDSVVATVAFTLWRGDEAEVWGLPLGHPESPFVDCWRELLAGLAEPLSRPKLKIVAHNGKFDGRWMEQFGCPVRLTFDTMLAAHVLDENRPKGLKPLAQSLLGAEPWDIDARLCMTEPLKKVMKYNGLDTWYTYHLYRHFKAQLQESPRLGNIMAKLMVPASNALTRVEREGIWVDRERLTTRAKIARDTLAGIDEELMTHVPPEDEWPEKLVKTGANFNPSLFSRWFLFEHLGYPVIQQGKSGPSMAEANMLKLLDMHPDDRVLQLMIERTKWQKYTSSFFGAYEELVDDNDHIHTVFKLHGTVTGRLSSGKNDADKVSGRVSNRGVNLQQVPRDNFVRGVFGAPSGWLFMECDYSQVELRVAAFLAQETTMLHLYRIGQDIHTTMAQRMVGRQDVTSEERKKAKAVNFGFLYGMGWRKFIDTAWANYGVKVSEEESRAFRQAFFTQFPKLPEWHNRQRRLVARYKRVESPLGRIRHLPDIDSADEGVKAEAQRQSINSPVQSFASDMCLLSLVILERRLRQGGFKARPVGTIHDAINFVVPAAEAPEVVPMVRQVMENLPLERMFGVNLTVPIVADVKLGRYWGDTREIDNDITSNPERLREYIVEHQSELGLYH